MQVLHAFKVYHPIEGGIQKSIRVLINGLKDQFDFEVLVCKKRGFGRSEKIDGVTVTRSTTLFELFSMPIAPWFLFQFWHKARKADLVVNHHPFPLNDIAITIYFPRKTKLIVHWHSDIIEQKRLSQILEPFIHHSLKRADMIIVSSKAMIEHSGYLRQYANKCRVVSYGLNIGYFSKLQEDEPNRITEIRQQYPGKIVLSVGRLVKYKGYKYLIDAAKSIDATFLVIGNGPLRESLQLQIDKAGLSHRFLLLGQLDEQQKKIHYHACDVFVLSSISRNEAFGLSQLEAMACAKPVINTALESSVSSVARHLKEGLTVPPMNTKALQEALQTLLSNQEYAMQLGTAGKARVNNGFDEGSFSSSMHEIYDELNC